MRRLTLEEQESLLDAISACLFQSGMLEADAICYGGPLDCYTKDRRHMERIVQAIPKEVADGYNKLLRKKEADRLRAKADAIEKGERNVC